MPLMFQNVADQRTCRPERSGREEVVRSSKVSSVSPNTVARGTSGQVLAVQGQFLDRKTTVKITGLTVTATSWVSFQEIDVKVNVPATVTNGPKKISLYDPYSSSSGYYGRGSCSACLSVG